MQFVDFSFVFGVFDSAEVYLVVQAHFFVSLSGDE